MNDSSYEQQYKQLIDDYVSKCDDFIITGGDTVIKIIQNIRQILPMTQIEEFDYIMKINNIIIKYSIKEILADPFGLAFSEIHLDDIFRDHVLTHYEREQLKLNAAYLLELIARTILNESLSLNPNVKEGNCYRIKRYDSYSITLTKFLPWG